MINAPLEKPLIRIDSEVTRRVRQHARAHMQTEVCGVLIGKLCDGILEIEAPIEAFNAAQAGAQVTFTQAAWETIYRVKDKDYPEDRIVGWYHSHPGFGVFLSDHDTFIHQNFFSSPDQVAWVYDPHSDEEGCFGWVNGSIRRIASIHVADNSGEESQRAGKQFGAGISIPPAKRPPPRTEKTLISPSQIPRNSPGFLSRFTAPFKKGCLAWVHFGRMLIVAVTPADGRPARTQSILSLSGGPRLEQATQLSSDARSGEATEQLPPESGQ